MFCFCRAALKLPRPKQMNKRFYKRCFPCHVACGVYVNSYSYLTVQIYKTNFKYLTSNLNTLNPIVRDLRYLEGIYKRFQNNSQFKSTVIDNLIRNEYQPSYVVDVLRLASDNSDCSSEFIFSFLNAVNKGITEGNVTFSPTTTDKIEALQSLLVYTNSTLINLVKNTFKIEENLPDVRKLVDDLMKSSKLPEAAVCIGAFSLQKDYSIDETIMPLLLDGKLHAALTLLNEDVSMQIEVAKKLDSLLERTTDATNYKLDINSKRVYRSLSSILKNFRISTEHCKNFRFIRTRGAINLLIRRRIEQSISEDTWENMVLALVGEDTHLKHHLIYKLAKKNDKETALKMMQKFNIHHFDFSKIDVASNSILESIEDSTDESSESTESVEYLKFNVSQCDIFFVDTEEKFQNFIHDITMTPGVIGLDSEWKPNFGLAPERLALMQLATHNKVFVLDLISLYDCLQRKHWDELIDDIFANEKLIKIGCGVISDIQMLSENVKVTVGKKLRFSHILDMVVLYDKLLEVYPNEMNDGYGDAQPKSLSKLCETLLGHPLNKEERLCDWEQRPLTDSQLEYAALDAHCLVLMLEKLKVFASAKNMNFSHIVKLAIYLTYRSWNPKKKIKKMRVESDFEVQKPIPINKFKVVMDSSLEALGKQLRQLGADVLVIESLTAGSAVEVSQSQQRILICFYQLWNEVKAISRETICCAVKQDPNLISFILQKFNVQLTTKKIFSRCAICNSEHGIRLSTEELKAFHDNVESNKPYEPDDNLETSSHQGTLQEMFSSGVKIRNLSDKLLSTQSTVFLCTKCGTVQ